MDDLKSAALQLYPSTSHELCFMRGGRALDIDGQSELV